MQSHIQNSICSLRSESHAMERTCQLANFYEHFYWAHTHTHTQTHTHPYRHKHTHTPQSAAWGLIPWHGTNLPSGSGLHSYSPPPRCWSCQEAGHSCLLCAHTHTHTHTHTHKRVSSGGLWTDTRSFLVIAAGVSRGWAICACIVCTHKHTQKRKQWEDFTPSQAARGLFRPRGWNHQGKGHSCGHAGRSHLHCMSTQTLRVHKCEQRLILTICQINGTIEIRPAAQNVNPTFKYIL